MFQSRRFFPLGRGCRWAGRGRSPERTRREGAAPYFGRIALLTAVAIATAAGAAPVEGREDAGAQEGPGHSGGEHHGHAGHEAHGSPYADQEESGIAALSRREREQLEAGAGMGLARAAELNGHPGPKHVLELAAELGLSPRQRSAVEAVFERMEGEAKRLGAEIVEAERVLDRRFEHRHLDEALLRELTAEIASLYGELRFVHLRAHLETEEILSPEQVAAYDRLRGYREAARP